MASRSSAQPTPAGTNMSTQPSANASQQPLTPEQAAAEAELLATKSALFRPMTSTNATTGGSTKGPVKESLATESARIQAEAEASLAQLALDLDGGDSSTSLPLDLTTSDIDFDVLGGDLRTLEENDLVTEALKQGVHLGEYAERIQKELAQHEQKCVEDYIDDADQLSTLHTQIKSCDSILATMESMLSHFQSDLSAISTEIQFLQEKSYSMNIKLRNYKGGEKALNTFIQQIYIPDDLCNLVLEGELNEPFVNGLIELDRKLLFLERSQRGSEPFSLAAKDMQPIGEKLKLKSIARIRAFLLERFHSLKKPKTNIQIKQKLLLKFSYFYQFLLHHADDKVNSTSGSERSLVGGGSSSNLHATASGLSSSTHPDICGEIRREYHETISTIYYAKFKKYLSELKKLQQDQTIEKDDTLGKDGSASNKSTSSGSIMGSLVSGMFSSKKSSSVIDNVFRLNGREEVLLGSGSDGGPGAAGDRDLIIPHLAGTGGSGSAPTKLPFEKLFKSSQSLLMDTATSEYDFIVEFFGERMQRDMDRAGVHEDAIAAEKEAAQKKQEDELESKAAPNSAKKPPTTAHSYELSQSEERGREHLAPHSRDKHLFNLVFGKTIQLFLEHLESYLDSCHDALGILLLIRIVCQHNIQMQYRRVHCLDHVFDRMNMMLWPKFKSIFDENVSSVMKVPFIEVKPGKNKPHFIGTRYAEFASGILHLNEGYDDDILIANLRRLRNEVERLFQRSSDRVASTPKLQVVFLLNNYHSILHILISHGHSSSDDVNYWNEVSLKQTSRLVEEELKECFERLITFLANFQMEESKATKDHRPLNLQGDLSPAKFKDILMFFHKSWQESIHRFYGDIQKNFTQEADTSSSGSTKSNTTTSSANTSSTTSSSSSTTREYVNDIFMRILTQLQFYCTSLERIWKKYYSQESGINQWIVPPTNITLEAKKYIIAGQ